MTKFTSNRGFTVIELLVVIGILGILVSIAMPQYSNYVNKARISEGRAALLDAGAKLERFYSDNNVYATADNTIPQDANGDDVFGTTTEGGYYTLSFESVTGDSDDADAADDLYQKFTLTATPTFDESRCRCLTYNSQGEKNIEACTAAPNNVAPTSNVNSCW